MPPIYLDYNASTPVEPAVAKAMRALLEQAFGNPSNGHWASAPAKATLERTRGQVAALIAFSVVSSIAVPIFARIRGFPS